MYSKDFYERRRKRTRVGEEKILKILLDLLPSINSAIDVGCGTGKWVATLTGLGVARAIGADGPWLEPSLLEIPEDQFVKVDLSEPSRLRAIFARREFDMAICVEVAEHLTEDAAPQLVNALTYLAPVVLFSAAIPGQGGVNHVNEQWLEYWRSLFEQEGFRCGDFIRRRIWWDCEIALCYRQNIVCFCDEALLKANPGLGQYFLDPVVSVVHPELWSSRISQPSIRKAWRLLLNAIWRRASRSIWQRMKKRPG